MIEDINIKCSVGALMYSPALNDTVAAGVIGEKYDKPYSLSLCLEDSIADSAVEQAEKQLALTLKQIKEAKEVADFYMPKIFVRVREPKQLLRLWRELEEVRDVIFGFIFPKYSSKSAEAYNDVMRIINRDSDRRVYMMPILESCDLIDLFTRQEALRQLKSKIDSVSDFVLNVRVGGNDFSAAFGVRRHKDETIYDIKPIADLLSDILTVFSREYVVSGPVWEYFHDETGDWKRGLQRELKLDLLNGFVGKTVIHPNQIAVVNEALKVSEEDYRDACEIAGWDKEVSLGVGKSAAGERMNEVKTHEKWARKVMILAENYGVKN